MIDSFLERVDREITARIDACLGPVSREQLVQPVQSNSRRALLAGVAVGIFVTGVPSMMVAASAGGVITKDESQVLFIVAILWAIALGIGAFVYPVSHYRRKEHGVRQTGRQAPRKQRITSELTLDTKRGTKVRQPGCLQPILDRCRPRKRPSLTWLPIARIEGCRRASRMPERGGNQKH